MTQPAKKNASWVWPALLLTLAVTAWAALSDAPEAELATPRAEKANLKPAFLRVSRSAAPAELPVFVPRTVVEYDPEDLFAGDAPSEDLNEAIPAKPTTPALPFTYAGRLVENSQAVVFLQDGERHLTVRAGDVIDNVWRIESITPSSLRFSYLPLRTVVPLTFGASN